MHGRVSAVSDVSDVFFRLVSFGVVALWVIAFWWKYPFSETYDIPTRDLEYDNFVVKARNVGPSGKHFVKTSFNLSDTVVYIDMWRSHWCTYYNDREFFFTPRINELAQIFRSIGVPIVHISMVADGYAGQTTQRKQGKEAVKRGNLSALEIFRANVGRYHPDYIPGFADVCVYKDQERFGKYRDNRLTKAIAVAEDDYMVQNFKEAAMSFVGLGKKTVIFLGQHTNMCLMGVFLYCREVGLDLVIVRDLVDSCWIYELQKNHCKTHTEGNAAVNDYFDKEFGCSVLSYDLIKALRRLKMTRKRPKYTMFANRAFMFRSIY